MTVYVKSLDFNVGIGEFKGWAMIHDAVWKIRNSSTYGMYVRNGSEIVCCSVRVADVGVLESAARAV